MVRLTACCPPPSHASITRTHAPTHSLTHSLTHSHTAPTYSPAQSFSHINRLSVSVLHHSHSFANARSPFFSSHMLHIFSALHLFFVLHYFFLFFFFAHFPRCTIIKTNRLRHYISWLIWGTANAWTAQGASRYAAIPSTSPLKLFDSKVRLNLIVDTFLHVPCCTAYSPAVLDEPVHLRLTTNTHIIPSNLFNSTFYNEFCHKSEGGRQGRGISNKSCRSWTHFCSFFRSQISYVRCLICLFTPQYYQDVSDAILLTFSSILSSPHPFSSPLSSCVDSPTLLSYCLLFSPLILSSFYYLSLLFFSSHFSLHFTHLYLFMSRLWLCGWSVGIRNTPVRNVRGRRAIRSWRCWGNHSIYSCHIA